MVASHENRIGGGRFDRFSEPLRGNGESLAKRFQAASFAFQRFVARRGMGPLPRRYAWKAAGELKAAAATQQLRDPATAVHERRVAALASAIAREMGLQEEQVEAIWIVGFVHDIGKIAVPAEILKTPGRLSRIQFDCVKQHPRIGYEILKEMGFAEPLAEVVLHHHERLNGAGYPDGLVGDNVLFGARILAVADVVEAISSPRPYRPALRTEQALEAVVGKKGLLYDPQAVDACARLFDEARFRLD